MTAHSPPIEPTSGALTVESIYSAESFISLCTLDAAKAGAASVNRTQSVKSSAISLRICFIVKSPINAAIRAARKTGQSCCGSCYFAVLATFSTNLWKIAATCARLASPLGMSLPFAPLTSFSATAHSSGVFA